MKRRTILILNLYTGIKIQHFPNLKRLKKQNFFKYLCNYHDQCLITVHSTLLKKKKERTNTDLGVSDIPVRVLVVERFTHLTVMPHSVVQAVITHSTTLVARCQIHRHVKVTLV